MHEETDACGGWRQFAATGSVYDYLDYKSRQSNAVTDEDGHADRNDGAGAAPGQGGGSGPDPDPAHP